MKALALALLLTSTGALAAGAAAPDCPKEITLSGARFLGGEEFPTDAQIETNFRQTFVTGGFRTYGSDDLAAAQLFVSLLRENSFGHTVTLRPFGRDADGACVGTLEGQAFTVDQDGVTFVLGEIRSVTIGIGDRMPVMYNLDLPSNCSGCVRETELFELRKVEAK